ncbi:MAG: PsbP-related protein, partial [Candidatus Nitrosocosmicus sp.]
QSKNISISSISNTLITQLKKVHKDFKLESSGQSILDSKKSRQIIFTATDNNLQNRKALQIVTINQNNIFIITYKASLDKYAQYESTIKDMISSFKFLKK